MAEGAVGAEWAGRYEGQKEQWSRGIEGASEAGGASGVAGAEGAG